LEIREHDRGPVHALRREPEAARDVLGALREFPRGLAVGDANTGEVRRITRLATGGERGDHERELHTTMSPRAQKWTNEQPLARARPRTASAVAAAFRRWQN